MKEERKACGTHRVFMEFWEGKESHPGGNKILKLESCSRRLGTKGIPISAGGRNQTVISPHRLPKSGAVLTQLSKLWDRSGALHSVPRIAWVALQNPITGWVQTCRVLHLLDFLYPPLSYPVALCLLQFFVWPFDFASMDIIHHQESSG